MAVKLTNLGGTNWIDGDTNYAADTIDTINATQPRKKTLTYSTETTTTSNSFTLVNAGASMTFGKANGLLLLVRLKCEAKISSTGAGKSVQVQLQISGTNLGTYDIEPAAIYQQVGPLYNLDLSSSLGGATVLQSDTIYRSLTALVPVMLPLLDTPTTISVHFKSEDGIATASIRNITVDAFYMQYLIND